VDNTPAGDDPLCLGFTPFQVLLHCSITGLSGSHFPASTGFKKRYVWSPQAAISAIAGRYHPECLKTSRKMLAAQANWKCPACMKHNTAEQQEADADTLKAGDKRSRADADVE
jgi:hypothetical protein